MKRKWIGNKIVFRSSAPAPAEFDAFSFFYRGPLLERFSTQVTMSFRLPDGNEHAVTDDLLVQACSHLRTDVSDRNPTVNPRQYRGKPITVLFRSRNGRIRFRSDDDYSFAFFQKDAKGQINWRQPFQTVDAVAQ